MRAYAVRVPALLGLLLAGTVVAPGVAHASCAGRSAAQIVADADVVLTGRLAAVDDPRPNYGPYDVAWTIEVSAVHKGRAPATAHVVATTYTHEGVVAGGSHVFALAVADGSLRAQGCQDLETVGTPEAAALVAAAGPGTPPAAGGSLPGSTAPAPPDATPWWSSPMGLVSIAVGGLLVLVVGGLVVALLAGLAVGGGRRRAADRASGQSDSTGTAFK